MGHENGLGHGVGLRSQHYPVLLEHPVTGVNWFEIISENFFEPGGRPWVVLERVRSQVPVVAHGVCLGIGNTDPISSSYLKSLGGLIARLEPAWVSDHLCWGAFGGHYAHDLWPLPYSREALDHVASRIFLVEDVLKQRLVLENVSTYVTFRADEMPEWEFLNALARRTGCGLLVDINNVYVSAQNHAFDAAAYIDAIDPTAVAQIHLAGFTDCGTHLFDTHVGPVPKTVWDLYRRAVRRFGKVPTLIEWDDAIPEYELLVRESQHAAQIEHEVMHEVVDEQPP